MELFALIMYVLAFALLIAAAFRPRKRVSLGWLGLACWVLPTLVTAAKLAL